MWIDAHRLNQLTVDQRLVLIPRVREKLLKVEGSIQRAVDRRGAIKSIARYDKLQRQKDQLAGLLGQLELSAYRKVFGIDTVLQAPRWDGEMIDV